MARNTKKAFNNPKPIIFFDKLFFEETNNVIASIRGIINDETNKVSFK
ncbi:hypothetical protein AQPE_3524 [Aquipluma nitroreducens]|uniref:Uncharacterized protein n=1 Tax=Aquipluma nitroreducens TaxID=2010828 RepID=A0A5K7SCY7_9BACT|nr:hypothetical protein AQPE_3524 [Aquipluma nitroreducens]